MRYVFKFIESLFCQIVVKSVPLMISTYGLHLPEPLTSGIVCTTIFSGDFKIGERIFLRYTYSKYWT